MVPFRPVSREGGIDVGKPFGRVEFPQDGFGLIGDTLVLFRLVGTEDVQQVSRRYARIRH